MEGGCKDLPVVSPFLPSEADQAVAFELPDQRVGLVALEVVGPRDQDFADEVRVGDGEAGGGPEP